MIAVLNDYGNLLSTTATTTTTTKNPKKTF